MYKDFEDFWAREGTRWGTFLVKNAAEVVWKAAQANMVQPVVAEPVEEPIINQPVEQAAPSILEELDEFVAEEDAKSKKGK